MMKRNILLALVTMTASASAGLKLTQPVVVTLSGTYRAGQGSIGSARNSADTNQYISCEIYGYAEWSSAYCIARDTAGNVASCYTRESEEMKKAVYSITYGSYISFSNQSTGDYAQCSGINVRTSSRYEPAAP